MLRPRLRIPRASPFAIPARSSMTQLPLAYRSYHSIPPLENIPEQEGKDGHKYRSIDGFLSPIAFTTAWDYYQTHVLTNLNRLAAETNYDSLQLKDVVLQTARDPLQAATFNYASMAHNNHFFFKCLSPKPTEAEKMPDTLKSALINSFGSLEALRELMVNTATAMFGPGFVWLVRTDRPLQKQGFRVLTTYLSGSPYPGAHWRKQSLNTATDIGVSTEKGLQAGKNYLEHSVMGAGRSASNFRKEDFAPGGVALEPVLCLNTWEHVWLFEYGFGGAPKSVLSQTKAAAEGGEGEGEAENAKSGKEVYAEKWWEHVDWNVVEKLAFPEARFTKQ
ncbi:putative mitochondrial SSU ribosomal protein S26 precursor [Triangularia verruculosa]|uniref:Mitochondrial SSU ribosomal protein S26 n=1 Tax=Triangularia verruculosa TaxID=2587418 RepID=A0AAN6XTB5_9PEZI|nr:putative mitochondrial SSU ribosomal protein S26 precursor [Triangularia verruculosa]